MSRSQPPDRGLRWEWRDWAIVALLGLGTALAVWWYWGRGPHLLSDTTMFIYRAFEVERSIGQGVPYPRLAMDFNFTYGAPLLEYRPPLLHYVIPAFHWLGFGWVDSARLTASIDLFLAGLGMYVYARWLFGRRRPALVSAAAYLLAPYLLFDIQVRGAIGEAAALAALPWLFWAMHHTLRSDERLWPWLGAFLTALLMLAHNIIALFGVPVLLVYLGLVSWRERSWRSRMPAVLISLLVGMGLSAFYWIPALLERGYALIEANMLSNRPIGELLSPINQWIQRQVAFDYWGVLRYRLALWQAVVAVVAILALGGVGIAGLRRRAHPSMGDLNGAPPGSSIFKGPTFAAAVLAGITAAVMLLQLNVSRPFWDIVPLVRFIQFPWRLLGIAAFCIALLAGFLFTGSIAGAWGRPRLRGLLGWAAAACFLALLLYAATYRFAPQFNPFISQLSENDVSVEGLSERGRSYFTLYSDFLPVGVSVDPPDLAKPRPAPDPSLSPMTELPAIAVMRDQPFRMDLQVRSAQPFTLRLHRFFFPGWQVYAGGKAVPTGASGEAGLVTAKLPGGEYPVVVQFGATPVRRLAGLITLASWIAWIVVGISLRRARPILIALGTILILAVVLAGVRFGAAGLRAVAEGGALRRPVSTTANFQDEISMLGYDLPKQTWRAGDDLPIRFYWLAQRTPAANYKVFVHLVKPDDSALVAQGDSFPLAGYSPTTRWEPGEIIPDDHQLHLDESIPPGKYLLLAGMYDPETVKNLPVQGTAKVLPGDRVVLTEIEVQGSSF
jgi:hypothetical protein